MYRGAQLCRAIAEKALLQHMTVPCGVLHQRRRLRPRHRRRARRAIRAVPGVPLRARDPLGVSRAHHALEPGLQRWDGAS